MYLDFECFICIVMLIFAFAFCMYCMVHFAINTWFFFNKNKEELKEFNMMKEKYYGSYFNSVEFGKLDSDLMDSE